MEKIIEYIGNSRQRLEAFTDMDYVDADEIWNAAKKKLAEMQPFQIHELKERIKNEDTYDTYAEMFDLSIIFDESYQDGGGQETLYFMAEKEYLERLFPNEDFSEASHCEISIEHPEGNMEPCFCNVSISPTEDVDGVMTDYDWRDIDIPYEEIEMLLSIYLRTCNKSHP